MAKEDVEIKEAIKVATLITISVMTPVLLLKSGSRAGVLPFEFTLPLSTRMLIISVFVVFDFSFAYSVMDQWME